MKEGRLISIRAFTGSQAEGDADRSASAWRGWSVGSTPRAVRTFKRSICVDGEVIKIAIVLVRGKEAVAA